MSININLLPWREERKIQKTKNFLMTLACAVGIIIGLLFGMHRFIVKKIEFQDKTNQRLQSEIRILDQKIAQIAILEDQKKELLNKIERLQRLKVSRVQVVRLLDNLAYLIPQGIYLTNLTRIGEQILIEGRGESHAQIATLMRNIETSKTLCAPELIFIQAVETKNAHKTNAISAFVRFHLRATQVNDKLETFSPAN